MTNLNLHEKPPIKNTNSPIYELVIHDIQQRAAFGIKKYGTFLQPFNGRNAAIDAYQEVLDMAMYIRQMVEEMGTMIAIVNAVVEFFEIGDSASIEHLKAAYDAYKAKRL